MKILIVNNNWYHSEILGNLLAYLNNLKNIHITFIYDTTHDDGNYVPYYINLNKNIKYKIVNFTSIKYIIGYLEKSNYLICLEELMCKQLMSKTYFKNNVNKIISFYHSKNHTDKYIFPNVKKLFLGHVPFSNNKFSNNYLIPNYFIDNKFKFNNRKEKKIYLIVGRCSTKHKYLHYLNKLNNYNCIIYLISRNSIDIKETNNIKFLNNISCNELLELYKKTDFILTLNEKNSWYHKYMITGVISFAISYGIPLITDKHYNELNKFNFLNNNLIYENNEEDFIKSFNYSLNMTDKEWLDCSNRIIKYRNSIIKENNAKYKDLLNI